MQRLFWFPTLAVVLLLLGLSATQQRRPMPQEGPDADDSQKPLHRRDFFRVDGSAPLKAFGHPGQEFDVDGVSICKWTERLLALDPAAKKVFMKAGIKGVPFLKDLITGLCLHYNQQLGEWVGDILIELGPDGDECVQLLKGLAGHYFPESMNEHEKKMKPVFDRVLMERAKAGVPYFPPRDSFMNRRISTWR
jgi:hypothetical protein